MTLNILMALTTPELIAELVRRGTTYAGSCTLMNWSNSPKGMTFGLKADQKDGEEILLHSHPFEGCYVGKDGDRFYVVAYPIANPEYNRTENDAPKALSSVGPEEKLVPPSANPSTPRNATYAQRSGLLRNDTIFHEYLARHYPQQWVHFLGAANQAKMGNSEAAAMYLRNACAVTSCSQIDGNKAAESQYDMIYNSFAHWRDYERIAA